MSTSYEFNINFSIATNNKDQDTVQLTSLSDLTLYTLRLGKLIGSLLDEIADASTFHPDLKRLLTNGERAIGNSGERCMIRTNILNQIASYVACANMEDTNAIHLDNYVAMAKYAVKNANDYAKTRDKLYDTNQENMTAQDYYDWMIHLVETADEVHIQSMETDDSSNQSHP